MLFRVTRKIDNIDFVIKNNVVLMIFIMAASLLNFGLSIFNIVFVGLSSSVIIAYRFQWKKMNDSRQRMLVGISYMVNSISMFVIGFVLAEVPFILLSVSFISFYVIEIFLIIYSVLKQSGEKDDENNNQLKYSTAALITASSLGVVISTYIRRALSYDIRITTAAFVFIGMSYIFALGARYIVLELKKS
ncbi:hypothetical protein [Alkaliphilus hydrothermalis]|uniref:Uncharacterized protein n=1 Tax=Alkaliphilus hydrothermalis TaxID=1482730 RepID=A0ABS2NQH7_9FIRM|nr:hypothetical protein [Alkaliphilus hydrothermalis]MBM7615096.1 hypothetical protein [Alkaliphilus hydrothermalis]